MTDCAVHRTHGPRPLGVVVHHIWPRGMQGPDVDSNRIAVCPTGHLNVHRLLDDLLASDGKTMRRGGTPLERSLARRGYAEWVAAGRPGHPVFEVEQP